MDFSFLRRRNRCLGLLLLGLWSCGNDGGIRSVSGRLALSETEIRLPFTLIGEATERRVQLSALDAPIPYWGEFLRGTSEFTVSPAEGAIQLGQPIAITVRFQPEQPGAREARIRFGSSKNEAGVELRVLATAGYRPSCDDSNPCTDDRYDPSTQRCVHTANEATCDDGNACTVNDRCRQGVCGGEARVCDDHNPCTDDLCSPATGCQFVPTQICDDNNPCTEDICLGKDQCEHRPLPAGSVCRDVNPCAGDRCDENGQCFGGKRKIPVGGACDDHNPCTEAVCQTNFACLDPKAPKIGEPVFQTPLGPYAEGAASNPLMDGRGSVYTATVGQVLSVDVCGKIAWQVSPLPGASPQFGAAVSLPGQLLLPFGDRILRLRSKNGDVMKIAGSPEGALPGLDLKDALTQLLAAGSAIRDIRVHDLGLRRNGAYLVSLSYTRDNTPESGVIEVDAQERAFSWVKRPSAWVSEQILVDRDESVILLQRQGASDAPSVDRRVERIGPENLLGKSWTSSSLQVPFGSLAFGLKDSLTWSSGPLSLQSTNGQPHFLPITGGPGPLIQSDRLLYVAQASTSSVSYGAIAALDPEGKTIFRFEPQPGETLFGTPAVDDQGRLAVLSRSTAPAQSHLYVLSTTGEILQRISPLPPIRDRDPVAITFGPYPSIVLSLSGELRSIAWDARLNIGPWPRRRADNLSSQHR